MHLGLFLYLGLFCTKKEMKKITKTESDFVTKGLM